MPCRTYSGGMAPSRFSTARFRRFAGQAKPWIPLAGATLALALAGCSGDGGAPSAASTAVAGETYLAIDSKPQPSVETLAALANGGGAGATGGPVGKVHYGIPADAALGVSAPLNGNVPLPFGDAWNRDVSQAAVDPASAALLAALGPSASLSIGFSATAGVPYAVVGAGQPLAAVWPAGDSPRTWPIPDDLPVAADGSGRAAILDRDAGRLLELHGASRRGDGGWTAASVVEWRLDAAALAPVDAAEANPPADGGMPFFVGLVRRDEAAAGAIRHALRVTLPLLRASSSVAPARRAAFAGTPDAALAPVGTRLRLRADFPIPPAASVEGRAILQALKTHGMVVAGTGPAWRLEGAPDPRWNGATLAAEIGAVRVQDLEVLAADASAPR